MDGSRDLIIEKAAMERRGALVRRLSLVVFRISDFF